jgi:hypothetical protein
VSKKEHSRGDLVGNRLHKLHHPRKIGRVIAADKLRNQFLRQRRTAYSEDTRLKRAADSYPYGYLIKPILDRELHATKKMALERSRADEAVRENQALPLCTTPIAQCWAPRATLELPGRRAKSSPKNRKKPGIES